MHSDSRIVAVLLAVLVVAAVVVPGVLAQETLTDRASSATLSDEALAEFGYEFNRNETFILEEQVETDDRRLTLRGTSEAVEYRREVDLGALGSIEGSLFGVVTIPAFERNGTVLNPIRDLGNPQLVDLLENRFQQIEIGQPLGNRTVTMLGNETTMTQFDGSARVSGATIGVNVYVAKVHSGDDFVVAAGVHPRLLGNNSETFAGMMGAVEHPGTGNETAPDADDGTAEG